MQAVQTKEIDGILFEVQQLPAMKAVLLMNRLAGKLGPAVLKSLAGVTSNGTKSLTMENIDLAGAADGLQQMFDRLTDADLEKLIRDLHESTVITKGDRRIPLMPVFDVEMRGKVGTILKSVRFALEVNYGNFFGAFLDAAKGMLPAPESRE